MTRSLALIAPMCAAAVAPASYYYTVEVGTS